MSHAALRRHPSPGAVAPRRNRWDFFPIGLGCVAGIDAAIYGVWTVCVPAHALAGVFFPALAAAAAVHLGGAARLAAYFGRRGMTRARRGAIFAILTTLAFCGIFLVVGLLMTFA